MRFTFSALVVAVFISAQQVCAFSTPKSLSGQSIRSSKLSSAIGASESADMDIDCIVVGGGISGSTLAHNINYQSSGDVSVILTEARDYIGGNVKSHRTEDGFLWEEGPNSFATQPSIVRISHELGIDDQLVFANESLPPWVNHNGKLHPLPKGQGGKGPKGQLELVFGPNGVLKFALAGELLSWPGKIRAGIGAFVGHLPPPEDKEENIREWVTRILGEEVFLRCIDPFVSGVYAGDPQSLSMQAALSKINRIEKYAYNIEWNKFGAIFYGGLARQVELTKERKADPPKPEWVEFEYGNPGSYREGLSTLPNAIAEELGDKIKTEWKLITIEHADENSEGYKYVATYDTPDGTKKVNAKAIVSTIPTHALQGSVLENVMPKATRILNTIRSNIQRKGVYHPPVAAVTVAYPKSSFKDIELPNGFGNLQNLPGFGLLNPRTEGVRTLGTLWSSSLFPGRCPEDYNLLLNYIGGSRDVGLTRDLTDEEIIGEVDKGCRQTLLKPDAPAPKVVGMKVWPTAIPQYELGHLDLMEELEEVEKDMDGLWVCGNYRSGVAFPDCVTFGYEHAKVVLGHLKEESSGPTPVPEVVEAELKEKESVTAVEIIEKEIKAEEKDEDKTEPNPVSDDTEAEVKEPETVAASESEASKVEESVEEAKDSESEKEIKAEEKDEDKTEPAPVSDDAEAEVKEPETVAASENDTSKLDEEESAKDVKEDSKTEIVSASESEPEEEAEVKETDAPAATSEDIVATSKEPETDTSNKSDTSVEKKTKAEKKASSEEKAALR